MENLCDSLKSRIMLLMQEYNINLEQAQRDLTIILEDYEIQPKENSITVYTEGKNDYFIKRFILAKGIAGCSKRTLSVYKDVINRFLGAFGQDADTITSGNIQFYLAKIIFDGKSKSYADTVRRYLSSFFAYLTREEFIKQNPMLKIDKIKYHNKGEGAFTDMEIEKMRISCNDARERAIIEILLSTGCRAFEIASIKLKDIENNKIVIFGKGGKFRSVYLNAKSMICIKLYLQERTDKNPYLFAGATEFKKVCKTKHDWYKFANLVSNDNHLGADTINIILKRIGKRAEIDGVHTHRFRRTCATVALRKGMPVELVSKMLGHEDLKTTQIYLDLQEEDLKIAHEKYVY